MSDEESLRLAIREPARIFPYDCSWSKKFEAEKIRLTALLPATFLAIEHMGSTAVPNLSAKPVIDLAAGLQDMAQADVILPMLCKNGYTTSEEFNATLVDRRWLMRHANGHRTHHLHLMIFGSTEWHRRLNFRDLLRRDVETARRYIELKIGLANAVGSDREAYTAAKSDFVEAALKRLA